MKIALVCRVYPSHRPGGLPFVVQDRARALAAAGHEVRVLTTSLGGGRGSESDDHGVAVHFMPCKPLVYSRQFAEHCERHCKAFEPDVIHLDSLDLNHRWWQSRPGNPKVTALTLHGFGWGSFFTKWNMHRDRGAEPPAFDVAGMMKEVAAFRSFDAVIGISRHEHWMLRDLCGLPQAKLVYNPIPDYFFEEICAPPPPDHRRRFLCAAISGQRERGFEIAKEAAKLAGVELIEVSNVDRRQMPAVIDGCHALVLPTAFAQGADLSVCEAIARCRPVILTATGSYLRESESGGAWCGSTVVVPVGSIPAVADAMRGPLPLVREWTLNQNRPYVHVANWLGAIGV